MPAPAEVAIWAARAAPVLKEIVVAHPAPLGTPNPSPRAACAGSPPRLTLTSVMATVPAFVTVKD